MTLLLTEADKREGFLQATASMAGAKQRWAERAERGMTDSALAEALAYELGIFGGSCGAGLLALTYQGAGLKIWVSREIHNHMTMKPTFEGKSALAMARLVYKIQDPANRQLNLL